MDDYRKRAIGGVMALDLDAIINEFDAAADIDNDDMREDRSYCARHIPALVAHVAELEAAIRLMCDGCESSGIAACQACPLYPYRGEL